MSRSYTALLTNIRASTLCEDHSHPQLPDELTLQSLWFSGQFGRDFVDSKGQAVRIIQWGVWNRSAGPDFLNVAIEIGEQIYRGALEVDTQASDWETHGHSTNPSFDQTCLHVIFTEPSRTTFTRNSVGKEIPRITIPADTIQEVLQSPRYASALAHSGRCSSPLATMPETSVTSLLESAALHRIQIKGRRLHRSIETHGWDETLWQQFATCLGYRPNSLAFTLLAQRLPIKTLATTPTSSEALLFGAAGFLSSTLHEQSPAQSRTYLRTLWDEWWTVRQDHEMDENRKIPWQFHGIRPSNHPHRRLGALSAIANQWQKISQNCLKSSSLEQITTQLQQLSHPFWDHQYTLLSKHSAKLLSIFGQSRIQDFIANTLAPIKLSETTQVWDQFLKISASGSNEKIAKAVTRLFGKRSDARQFTKKVYQQQALLQIYDDFCLEDSSDCEDCPFPEQLSQWK